MLGHLPAIVKHCDDRDFNIKDFFAMDDSMLTSTVRVTHSDTCINLRGGHKVTSVFPVVELSCDIFSQCPDNDTSIAAVTDGDATMWNKFKLHLPVGKFDPCFQFCDWHKGQSLKKDGEVLLSQAQEERRRRGQNGYDETHKLGSIFANDSGSSRKFSTLFGPLLHVVRRHESEPVVKLFWTLFTEKAFGCGMFVDLNSYEKLHHFKTGTSGRYGMCNFVSQPSGRVKYGCGVTANSLEARANKNIKAALGTKLGFVAIHAIVKKSCSSQCRQTCHLRFSVRQACHGDCRSIYDNRESSQYGENPVGANWRHLWTVGIIRAGDDAYWNTYCWLHGTSAPHFDFTIATNVAVEMCRKMQLYYNDASKTLRDYCNILKQDWLSFMRDPFQYRRALVAVVKSFNIQRARDHGVNASAYLNLPKNWRPSEAEVFGIVEKDLLFQQKVMRVVCFTCSTGLTPRFTIQYAKAFVKVTCNERRLENNRAKYNLHEPWRFRPVFEGGRVTVDYQAFICHGCKQFNTYGFCVHCIMCGMRTIKGLD